MVIYAIVKKNVGQSTFILVERIFAKRQKEKKEDNNGRKTSNRGILMGKRYVMRCNGKTTATAEAKRSMGKSTA